MRTLALTVSRFGEHKRRIGRKYESEEAELRLLVRFAEEHGASRLEELTPVLLDDFLASRSRPRHSADTTTGQRRDPPRPRHDGSATITTMTS